jgi:DNA-binding transcriptional LysR family regulator
MDRLVSMAVFKQTVDAGSFAAAARYLGISPEMAGNHVRGLETHLGVRLLNRSTRRLNLTEAGGIYYERCTRILADIQDAEAEVGVLQASPRGLLRVAAPVTFGVLHIAPAVSEYMTRYPEVKLDVAVSDRHVNLIEEGYDLAIRVGELQDSNLVTRRLTSAHLIVCAAPAYLRRRAIRKSPPTLLDTPASSTGKSRPRILGGFRVGTVVLRRCASPARSLPRIRHSCIAWR